MFKTRLNAVFTAIKTTPLIKWIDEDFGQIDNFESRPSVSFPAALVALNQSADPQGGDEYDMTDSVTIRVAHDRTGDRSAISQTQAYARTLNKLDTVQAVIDAMKSAGYYHIETVTELRSDGLSVHTCRFKYTE